MTTPARSKLSNPDLFDIPPVDRPESRRGRTSARVHHYRNAPSESLHVGIEIRMRDTQEGAENFKRLREQVELMSDRRLHEAVLERAARRFLVQHAGAIVQAAARQRFVGRTVVEEDVIEVLDRAFGTGRADPGLIETHARSTPAPVEEPLPEL